ncbi:MAG: hypothetical protein JST07_00590 [Bacteroidetes bacterium]|nr:hypothetical protein [Bacteroidota bacterium]
MTYYPFIIDKENIGSTIEFMKKNYNLNFAKNFFRIMENQVHNYFEANTGISVGKRVQLTTTPLSNQYDSNKMVTEVIIDNENVSRLKYGLWIGSEYNFVTVAWNSKSGRLYKTSDEDIDSEDIVFWMEELNPLLYHKQLYPKEKFPFKLPELSFELILTRLVLNCIIVLYLKELENGNWKNISLQLDDFIAEFNKKSEKAKKFTGVIHNWKKRSIKDNIIEYEFDLGSVELIFFKNFLKYLSDLNYFTKVEIL